MNKYNNCKICIHSEDECFESICKKCENESELVTHLEFNEDCKFWFEDMEEEKQAEELKLKYFPIRWLIRWILKTESNFCSIWFCRIAKSPFGDKQENDNGSFLYRLLFPFVYIAQSCGYVCDDYHGNMYFRLFPFVWLEFEYQC